MGVKYLDKIQVVVLGLDYGPCFNDSELQIDRHMRITYFDTEAIQFTQNYYRDQGHKPITFLSIIKNCVFRFMCNNNTI